MDHIGFWWALGMYVVVVGCVWKAVESTNQIGPHFLIFWKYFETQVVGPFGLVFKRNNLRTRCPVGTQKEKETKRQRGQEGNVKQKALCNNIEGDEYFYDRPKGPLGERSPL